MHDTPLYIAAQNGYDAIVQALIKAKADVNAATIVDGNDWFLMARDSGVTPLFIAAEKGHDMIVLADVKMPIRMYNCSYSTPVSVAKSYPKAKPYGYAAIEQILRDAGAV